MDSFVYQVNSIVVVLFVVAFCVLFRGLVCFTDLAYKFGRFSCVFFDILGTTLSSSARMNTFESTRFVAATDISLWNRSSVPRLSNNIVRELTLPLQSSPRRSKVVCRLPAVFRRSSSKSSTKYSRRPLERAANHCSCGEEPRR